MFTSLLSHVGSRNVNQATQALALSCLIVLTMLSALVAITTPVIMLAALVAIPLAYAVLCLTIAGALLYAATVKATPVVQPVKRRTLDELLTTIDEQIQECRYILECLEDSIAEAQYTLAPMAIAIPHAIPVVTSEETHAFSWATLGDVFGARTVSEQPIINVDDDLPSEGIDYDAETMDRLNLEIASQMREEDTRIEMTIAACSPVVQDVPCQAPVTPEDGRTNDELIATLKELGVRANKRWKRETLLNKLAEVNK